MKSKLLITIMLVAFAWISLSGCSTPAANTGHDATVMEKAGGSSASATDSGTERDLSRKQWDQKRGAWYRYDRIAKERIYQDSKAKKWYKIEKPTGERVYVEL